ncbi:SDR family oxidoreductase [uncultured Tenacibaculum sp.]|uniref:SDR family oxidoreductase n=1 Tax=uncultured Tenacibaculum sp. TaxID=174713 RepID=UPI00261EF871|nr:SDR family oxidoreductase [uncultured Tenacibaculum sp.]
MILVTGGTGLVGSHLLYHLTLKNDTVLAIYRTEERIKNVEKVFSYYTNDTNSLLKKIRWIQGDITDIPSLKIVFSNLITQVYHCAALVSFNPKDYKKMRRVNIDGTANIVNFCIDNTIKKICFVSSIATVGDSINDKIITEENEWQDSSNNHGYAITKYGAEMEIWRASQEGVEVVVVNPGVILGSGFWKEGSGKLFTQVFNGFKFYTEGVTGFVSVKDVIKIMIMLEESNIKNERFILVSENKSFKEVLSIIAKGFDKKGPTIKVNKLATKIFWRIDWLVTKLTGKEPLLTKNSAKSSHNKSYYSSQKVKDALTFDFEPIPKVINGVCKDYL